MIIHVAPGYSLIRQYAFLPRRPSPSAMLVYAEDVCGLVIDPASGDVTFMTEGGLVSLHDRGVVGIRAPHATRICGVAGEFTTMQAASEHVRASLISSTAKE